MTTGTYKVSSQPHAYSAEALSEVGTFDDYEVALAAAAKASMANIWQFFTPGQTARELYDLWLAKGSSVSVVPDPDNRFSSMNFARLIVTQMTKDYSHPQLIEISCKDCLNFPSGATSPPKEWKFYLRAPATYDNSAETGELIKCAVDMMYEDMSREAMNAEGSSYTLLAMAVLPVAPEKCAALLADPKNQFLWVQRDGSFSSKAPVPKVKQ